MEYFRGTFLAVILDSKTIRIYLQEESNGSCSACNSDSGRASTSHTTGTPTDDLDRKKINQTFPDDDDDVDDNDNCFPPSPKPRSIGTTSSTATSNGDTDADYVNILRQKSAK